MAALLCLAAMQSARADLWAYVDSRGVTHFAAEQIDANYTLFFRGDQFDSTRDASTETSSGAASDEVIARVGSEGAGARKLAFIDISPGYKRVRTHIRGVSQTSGIEYELLKAVIATESGFDSLAVSPRGAVGLMQLMPATASRFGVAGDKKRSVTQKLEDPLTNMNAGASYLRYLLKMFDGRKDLALAAYNAGEGAVQRAGNKIPAYRETQNYVKSVLGLYAMLKPPEPLRSHREFKAQQGVAGRIRMEIPAGAAEGGIAPSPSSSSSPTTFSSPLGAAGSNAMVRTAARAPLQDLSANE
ncbi:lytic transglycosylase domain-containing protein [Diaphorobacter aerolatus]|uniref:Lytic transglycosylase domain-containing protein n=2 Tax=Diaphorobacter aerolatus TaxID=1288495 RepID=A0A7H0GQP3_9BURK|nr:lytic transglycosylase domain-containing protein [Diaphorobacter aerolatus]QNP50609.1 lytic transglycosylase domain-containing protein [Diaphorobacter aerolatus]